MDNSLPSLAPIPSATRSSPGGREQQGQLNAPPTPLPPSLPVPVSAVPCPTGITTFPQWDSWRGNLAVSADRALIHRLDIHLTSEEHCLIKGLSCRLGLFIILQQIPFRYRTAFLVPIIYIYATILLGTTCIRQCCYILFRVKKCLSTALLFGVKHHTIHTVREECNRFIRPNDNKLLSSLTIKIDNQSELEGPLSVYLTHTAHPFTLFNVLVFAFASHAVAESSR